MKLELENVFSNLAYICLWLVTLFLVTSAVREIGLSIAEGQYINIVAFLLIAPLLTAIIVAIEHRHEGLLITLTEDSTIKVFVVFVIVVAIWHIFARLNMPNLLAVNVMVAFIFTIAMSPFLLFNKNHNSD